MTCLTCHHACDCREKEMRELLESFVQDHADVDAINGRRHSNCDWCQRAKKLLGVEVDG